METLLLIVTIASGIGASRRSALWWVPVVIGVAVAAQRWTGGTFDDSGNHVALSMVIIASYLGAAGLGWFIARAAQVLARARTSAAN